MNMHKLRILAAVLLLAGLVLPSFTAGDAFAANELEQSFADIRQAIVRNDAASLPARLTKASRPLFARFAQHGLLPCAPKDARLVKQDIKNERATLLTRFTAPDGDSKQARLIFSKEEGSWKLNLPATLERGMGKNWQTQVNTAEQLYLLIQQQLGPDASCHAVLALFKPQ